MNANIVIVILGWTGFLATSPLTSWLRGHILAGISWISADSKRSDYVRLEFRVCCGSGIDYLKKHTGWVQSLCVCVWILTVFPQDSCFDRLNVCRKITGHGGPQGPGVILKAFCVIRLTQSCSVLPCSGWPVIAAVQEDAGNYAYISLSLSYWKITLLFLIFS